MNIYWKNVINGFFTDPNNWVQGVVPGAGDIAELTSSAIGDHQALPAAGEFGSRCI
jgi:hypothetical protein